jgi:hypothetical protein
MLNEWDTQGRKQANLVRQNRLLQHGNGERFSPAHSLLCAKYVSLYGWQAFDSG